ncbi:TICRR protein, partial [Pachyramphus minor]|nr:TICRR protein [Pachyramphus minor]
SAGRERVMKISEHLSSKVTNTPGEFELEGICRLQDQPSPSGSEPRADEDSAVGTFGSKSQKRVFTFLSPEKEENHDAKRLCADRCSLDLTDFSTDEGNRSKSRTDSVLPEKSGMCALKTLEQQSSVGDDDVFLLSGSTPPLKSTLSASSLLALTQSPLLSPPPAWRKCVQGNNLSPVVTWLHGVTRELWQTVAFHVFFLFFVEEESDAIQIAANQELSPFPLRASRKHPLCRTYSRRKLLS